MKDRVMVPYAMALSTQHNQPSSSVEEEEIEMRSSGCDVRD